MKSRQSLASFATVVALLTPHGQGFHQQLQYPHRHNSNHARLIRHQRRFRSGGIAIRPTTAIAAAYTTPTSAQDISGKTFDLAVIGAGPVGVSAALRAARSPYHKNVVLIDAPRASGMLMDERTGEDLSLGGPTGLFSKALRDTGKRISVSSLKGMGLRDDRCE